jgi:MFS family permease
MNYFRFFRANRTLISFGLLTAFSSSFGQTFFISLFLPHILREFSLSKSEFGLLYSASTLLGAMMLPCVGRLIDQVDIRRYTMATILVMSGSALLVAVSSHVAALGLGLVGLRLTGQGLLGHISHTVMVRDFPRGRGKALGIAGVGYPLGEALLPAAFVLVIALTSWRTAWSIVAIAAVLILMPFSQALLRSTELGAGGAVRPEDAPHSQAPGEIRFDRRFYLLLPSVLVLPFLLTALFLYQSTLAESRGWPTAWLAAAFSGYALARAFSSLAAGPLIDRYSAHRLLPLYLWPLAAGLLLLACTSSHWMAFGYLLLTGLTAGSSGNITSAAWAEFYGPACIGRVRSLTAALAILSTAASPALFGWMLDLGVSFGQLLNLSILLLVMASALAAPIVLRTTTDPACNNVT